MPVQSMKKIPKNSHIADVRFSSVTEIVPDVFDGVKSVNKAKYQMADDNGLYLLVEHYGDRAITYNWSFYPGHKTIKTLEPNDIRWSKYHFATISHYAYHADGKHLGSKLNDLLEEEGFHLIKDQLHSNDQKFYNVISNFMQHTKEILNLSEVTHMEQFSFYEGKEQSRLNDMIYAASLGKPVFE